jgi:lipopolysaccharide transport system permease protein
MTKRELTEKHAGQMLGVLWAFVHPAIQVAVYVFIFVVVFAVRIGGTEQMPRDYTTYLLVGLIPWLACADAMMRGTGVLIGNANLVKQVVFPLEVLPVKTVLVSMFTLSVSMALLFGYVTITQGGLPWTSVFVPFLIILQTMGLVGVCCVLCALGAYFRDLREFLQIITSVGMYLMPIAYMPSMVPAAVRTALYLNPFSYLVWCYQDALYFGRFEHPAAWFVCPMICLGSFIVGYRMFRKLKPFFGNML